MRQVIYRRKTARHVGYREIRGANEYAYIDDRAPIRTTERDRSGGAGTIAVSLAAIGRRPSPAAPGPPYVDVPQNRAYALC